MIKVEFLYNVPQGSRIRPVDEEMLTRPPGDIAPISEVLTFNRIDGMYSHCTTDAGHIVHLAAWTVVEIVVDK